MIATYTLSMLWWEVRLLVSTFIVGYIFQDMIAEFHRRLFEIYCSLYTAPCTIEVEKVALNMYNGTLVIHGCCLCVPDKELGNPWLTRVIARSGRISISCHPIRYLLAYLGTAGDLMCVRSIEVDEVDFVIEKRPDAAAGGIAVDRPTAVFSEHDIRINQHRAPSVSPTSASKGRLPPLNFSCQLMGRSLSEIRLGIPDYDTGPARGIMPVPSHLNMPKSRSYVISEPRQQTQTPDVCPQSPTEYSPLAGRSASPGASSDEEQSASSMEASPISRARTSPPQRKQSPTTLDSVLVLTPALEKTYRRIKERTSKLYEHAVRSTDVVSSALNGLYQVSFA
jgi:hypothetical protein